MRIAGCNRVIAFAYVVSTIGSDAAKLLIRSDLTEQVGKHRRILLPGRRLQSNLPRGANAAARDLDRTYLLRLLINPDVDLAP